MHNVKPRVAVLWDEVNIYLTAQRLYGKVRVNPQAMFLKLNQWEIKRTIAYCVETPENDLSIFRRNVKRLGIEVKSKPVKIFRDGKRKGDWDVGITVDAIELANQVDEIFLVTCDGDFESLILHLRLRGRRVGVMAFEPGVSYELKRSIDEFIPITEDMLIKRGARSCPLG